MIMDNVVMTAVNRVGERVAPSRRLMSNGWRIATAGRRITLARPLQLDESFRSSNEQHW